MPLSDKQLAANRANAKKSKGPVTPQGKRNSARNNTRHGLLASILLIAGESRERFNVLVNGLYAEYRPETPTEISFVNKIAASQWRQQRAWAMESACLTQEIQNQPLSQASADPALRAILAVRSMGDHSHQLDLMSRYEHRYDRQQYRAIEALNRLRQARKPPVSVARDETETERNEKLPFDPTQPGQNQQIPEKADPVPTPSGLPI